MTPVALPMMAAEPEPQPTLAVVKPVGMSLPMA
jgi:hypothetical protein